MVSMQLYNFDYISLTEEIACFGRRSYSSKDYLWINLTPVSQNTALPLFLIKTCFPITMFGGYFSVSTQVRSQFAFSSFTFLSRHFTPDVVACSAFDKQLFDIGFLENPESRECRLKLRKGYHT